MLKIKCVIQKELEDYRVLLRNVPPVIMVFFAMSVILMNLLANRELLNISWLALDCGFVLSWLSFLCMDILTKRFGAKAAIKLSILAVSFNLFTCMIFFLITRIPGNWGEFYNTGDQAINEALDATFGGTWYVLLGSMTAFIVSAIVNAIVNAGLGKLMKKNTFREFAVRSYVSTALGQFVDNMIFALIVSHVFFGWSMTQVFTCSIAGALTELLSEVVFSPIGFRVCKNWEKNNIGQEYIEYAKGAIR